MCKFNFASYVRVNTPIHNCDMNRALVPSSLTIEGKFAAISSKISANLALTKINYGRIFNYTVRNGVPDAQARQDRRQDCGTEPKRNPQSAPRGGGRCAVSQQSILRRPRPAANPIRDAASPSRRGPIDCRCCSGFRSVTPHLLPGTGRVRRARPGWVGASAARPQGTTQALARGLAARPGTEDRGLIPQYRKLREGDPPALWYSCSSPQSGTRAAEQKKHRNSP